VTVASAGLTAKGARMSVIEIEDMWNSFAGVHAVLRGGLAMRVPGNPRAVFGEDIAHSAVEVPLFYQLLAILERAMSLRIPDDATDLRTLRQRLRWLKKNEDLTDADAMTALGRYAEYQRRSDGLGLKEGKFDEVVSLVRQQLVGWGMIEDRPLKPLTLTHGAPPSIFEMEKTDDEIWIEVTSGSRTWWSKAPRDLLDSPLEERSIFDR
jgi:hypothetical protein